MRSSKRDKTPCEFFWRLPQMKLDTGSYNDANPNAKAIQFAHLLVSGGPSIAKCRLQLQRQRAQVVYARQDTMARSSSGPKSPEYIATSVPAPRTTAINLSAIIFESPIEFNTLGPSCFRNASWFPENDCCSALASGIPEDELGAPLAVKPLVDL